MIIPAKTPHPATWGDMNNIWVDADTDDKRVLNGSNISQLQDKSLSPLNNFSQGSASNQPLYNPTGIAGRGAIQNTVDGSSKRLRSSNSGSSSTFYVSFVYMLTPSPSTSRNLYGVDFGFAVWTHDVIKLSDRRLRSRFYQFNWGTVELTTPGALNFSQPYLIEVLHDGPGSLHEFYINENLVASTTNVSNFSGTRTDISLMNSGNANLSLACVGLMGPFLFLRGSIPSLAVRQWRRKYLANWCGITI